MATASVYWKLEALSMSEAKVAVVPWLDLPDYLTEKILERLPILDYLRFGAVCRRWRSIRTAHRLRHAPAPPPMVNLPWFIPHRPTQASVLCSEVLNGRRSHQRLHIPLSPRYLDYLRSEEGGDATQGGGEEDYCVPVPASSSLPHGWLLFDDWPLPWLFDPVRVYRFTLLNPITGVQIQLPSLGTSYGDLKATMSPPPRLDIVAITFKRLRFDVFLCRPGNPFWTRVDYRPNDFRHGAPIALGMVSAIHYKGTFYCLFLGKGLMAVDSDCPLEHGITGHYFEMDQSLLPEVYDFVEYGLKIFLVESNGKMLLVLKFSEYDPSSTTPTLVRFELCEADLSNRRWVKVESLGDQSLFIHRNFFDSLLAADAGVKGNCIYFLDPPTDEPASWNVFDVGTGKVDSTLLACPPLRSAHLMFVPSIY